MSVRRHTVHWDIGALFGRNRNFLFARRFCGEDCSFSFLFLRSLRFYAEFAARPVLSIHFSFSLNCVRVCVFERVLKLFDTVVDGTLSRCILCLSLGRPMASLSRNNLTTFMARYVLLLHTGCSSLCRPHWPRECDGPLSNECLSRRMALHVFSVYERQHTQRTPTAR